VAPLEPVEPLIAWARLTRQEAVVVRTETRRLTRASAFQTRRLARRRQLVAQSLTHAVEVRERLPTWPAWAPPDTAELRLTLVELDDDRGR
jgi:hypothetical protein